MKKIRFLLWCGMIGTWMSFLGSNWDFWWHVKQNPETFFSVPHLVLYAGVMISGFSVLGLLVALMKQQGERYPYFLRYAPQVALAGAGSVIQLFAGISDGVYHELIGFDVTLWSPPHVLAIFGNIVFNIGLGNLFWHLYTGRMQRIGYVLANGAALGALLFAVQEYDYLNQLGMHMRWETQGIYLPAFIGLVSSLLFASALVVCKRTLAVQITVVAFLQKLVVYAGWQFSAFELEFPLLIFMAALLYSAGYRMLQDHPRTARVTAAVLYGGGLVTIVALQGPHSFTAAEIGTAFLLTITVNVAAAYAGQKLGTFGLWKERGKRGTMVRGTTCDDTARL